MFVYDLSLTSGEMLYSCAGGIGATKEKYLVKIHEFLKRKSSVSILQEVFAESFKNGVSRTMYLRLRENFNNKIERFGSLEDCAKLFLLWGLSGFTHRYRTFGYDGIYCPIPFNFEHIRQISQISREKNLLFRNENWNGFSEFLIHSNIFLYLYFPSVPGVYGPGFKWNVNIAKKIISKIYEFHSKGYKICVCTRGGIRGMETSQYISSLSFLTTTYIVQFKDLNLSLDTYLLNF